MTVVSTDHNNIGYVGTALGLVPVEEQSNLFMKVAKVKATDSHLAESVAQLKAASAAKSLALLKATAAELGTDTIEIDGQQLLVVEPIENH